MPTVRDHECREWLDAITNIIEKEGVDRARFLVEQVAAQVGSTSSIITSYKNTLSATQEPAYPGDVALEEKNEAAIRWNAIALVLRAKATVSPSLGGHLSSFASIALLYEVGQNHFFKGHDKAPGDLVYFQGHSSEGNYARAYLEGRLTTDHMCAFRQEIRHQGLSSYPHPWLMKEFWQFATVSLGLGAIQGIYQAQFLKYLEHRELLKTAGRRVWVFLGDGEMDEPESVGALSIAGREKLDNLTFVVNCNLQRLDGLVRSNYKVVQELEGIFRGHGWHVIKVCWGEKWDALFAKDTQGELLAALNTCVDGDLQTCTARGGAYIREHFFGKSPTLAALVADRSDADLQALFLDRGAFSRKKIYAAYHAATTHTGQPTVILCQGIKGYGLGSAAESQNIAHNATDMNAEQMRAFRDRFQLPLTDAQLDAHEFYAPAKSSAEYQYLQAKRQQLGGPLPARRVTSDITFTIPPLAELFPKYLEGSGDRDASSTMMLARIIDGLMKDKTLGRLVAPMFSDEVRTFGMEGLFRAFGIYSPEGQKYTPEDKAQLMYYKEEVKGQVLELGITEAGCMASWLAAATSYSTNNFPMIPIFTYYSMFGMQRLGDYVWAAGDMRARGFLVGATAGRTTLEGEGLQHQDGQTLLIASYIPNCVSFDPTFGYEIAVIMRDGLKRMLQDQEDIYVYFTAMNEKYAHPAMPANAEEGILKGMYLFAAGKKDASLRVHLLGSGTIFREVIAAAAMLDKDFGVSADIWSAISMSELRRDGLDVERYNRTHPDDTQKVPYVQTCLSSHDGPVIAATDYVKAYSDLIRPFISQTYITLGTDGYGRSDTRAASRAFFEVDRYYIAFTAIDGLYKAGRVPKKMVVDAMKKYNIDPNKPNPLLVDGWN